MLDKSQDSRGLRAPFWNKMLKRMFETKKLDPYFCVVLGPLFQNWAPHSHPSVWYKQILDSPALPIKSAFTVRWIEKGPDRNHCRSSGSCHASPANRHAPWWRRVIRKTSLAPLADHFFAEATVTDTFRNCIFFDHRKITFVSNWGQSDLPCYWGSIRCKHIVRWQHQSLMKNVMFCKTENIFNVSKM